MRITVENYRRIQSAALESGSTILIGGRNGAGKSSLLQAVSACLVRDGAAPTGILKKESALLVHDGAGKGRAAVEAGGGKVSVAWPSGSVREDGEAPPFASAIAAGLESPLDLKPKDRLARITALFPPRVTPQDFRDAMTKAGFASEQAFDLWHGMVLEQGWDATLASATEVRAKKKGAWERITGTGYGSKIAEGWTPQAYDADADTAALEQAVRQAEAAYDEALRSQGRGEAARAELQAIIDRAGAYDIPAMEQAVAQARQALEQANTALSALPRMAGASHTLLDCPHCGAQSELFMADGKKFRLVEPTVTAPTPEDVEAHLVASERCKELATALTAAESPLSDARAAIREAEVAREKLVGLGDPKRDTATGDGASVEQARSDVLRAEARLEANKGKTEADTLHSQIGKLENLVAFLAPGGLRMTAMEKALSEFNDRLAELANAAKWPVLRIGEGAEPFVDGRPFALVAESWQWRARVLFQIAMAERDGSSMVVIDRADVLDQSGRNGLFLGVIGRSTVPHALVAMTFNKPDLVPDLGRVNGATYWLEDGQAVPLADAITTKQAA